MTGIARPHDVRTPDGRTLRAYEAGDPDGELVLVHHGTPGSGILAAAWAQDASARGIRLVGFDRAGYGASDRRPGRSIADNVADSVAVVDALGGGSFRTWGVSGGGPHALACAAMLPDRVSSVAALASVAPYDAQGLDWPAGMGQGNLDEFGAAVAGEAKLRPFLEPARAGALASGAAGLAEEFTTLLPAVDVAALTGEFAEFMYAWLAGGLRDGYEGWLDDDLAFVRPWGFDPAAITVAALVLQGRLDLMVPFDHGQWLAGRIPGVTAWLTDDDGHLSLLAQLDQVHAWLLAH
jgi:pimeloyl-ACP methyl ester carboxylesterase